MKLARLFAFSAALVACTAVQAQDPAPIVSSAPISSPVVIQSSRYPAVRSAAPSRGLVDQVMELERRKNAWLRRTFLGR